MERVLAAAVCGVVLLAGCSGSTSSGSGGSGGSGSSPVSAPTANAGGPYTGTAGTALSFSSAGSSDPQGQTLSYAWNFGDSGTATGASPTHTYTAAGTYTVTLTATDTSDLPGTATAKATIAAAALADVALTGTVTSGTQPVVGAHVYLFAANTSGYGGTGISASSSNASVSLVSAARTGTVDSTGAYVTSGVNGGFSLTGDYSCATGQQLYLYALGGNAGPGTNAGLGMLAAVGACPATSAPAISVTVNEVSTVAAAYAMAGFATDATHVSSSGTALAQVGIANAFASAGQLEILTTGVAPYTMGAGDDDPYTLNTLADILATCVNSNGTVAGPPSVTPCYSLFSLALSGGASGTQPGETATAAINIAHFPFANPTAVFNLMGTTQPFTPVLTAPPNFGYAGYFIGVSYTLNTGPGAGGLAVDASGNVWQTSYYGNSVAVVSTLGNTLIPGGLLTGNGLNQPNQIAIDSSGNAWVSNTAGNSISEFLSSGSPAPGSPFSGNGLSSPGGIAIDGHDNVWVSNYGGNSVTELTNTGTPSTGSPFTAGGVSSPGSPAFDGSGNIWIPNGGNNSVTELNSAGVATGNSPYAVSGTQGSEQVVTDQFGDAWVVSGNSQLTKLSPTGNRLAVGGGFGTNIGIDGAGNVWSLSTSYCNGITGCSGSMSESSPSGLLLSKYANSGGNSIVVDGSGNVWASSLSGVVKYVGAGVPVVTPISAGVKINLVGTRP